MPIYAYRCTDCGHAQDVLQKMSDDVLTVCPACGASNYIKQVTAAGFQLKGSGWYVTDFRGGNSAAPKPAETGDTAAKPAETSTEKSSDKGSEKSAEKAPEKTAAQAADKSSEKAAPAPSAPAAAPSSGS